MLRVGNLVRGNPLKRFWIAASSPLHSLDRGELIIKLLSRAPHKRFKLHFIPTSSSWLNLVERFFALITQNAIRRGVFNTVDELEATIADYLSNHNAEPKPFVWTKSADVNLAKVDRARTTLAAVKAGNQPLELVH